MLEQFQNILDSPKHNQHEDLLKRAQNLILNALQNMFPPEYDFSQLAGLYDNPTISNSPTLLCYHLIDYFIQVVSANFVSIHSYSSLESQTQKLEETVRSHIKLQQEVKMYLEHLEAKIRKYENYIEHVVKRNANSQHRISEAPPTQKETQLLRERLTLIKRNEQLQRKLKEKEDQMKKYNEVNSSHIEFVQSFLEKDKLVLSKSQQKLSHIRGSSDSKSHGQFRLQNASLAKLKTPTDYNREVVIQINGNHKQLNYCEA